jgi:hypothetical protein
MVGGGQLVALQSCFKSCQTRGAKRTNREHVPGAFAPLCIWCELGLAFRSG